MHESELNVTFLRWKWRVLCKHELFWLRANPFLQPLVNDLLEFFPQNGLPPFPLLPLQLQNTSLLFCADDLVLLPHSHSIHAAMTATTHNISNVFILRNLVRRQANLTTAGDTRVSPILQEGSHPRPFPAQQRAPKRAFVHFLRAGFVSGLWTDFVV